MPQIKLSNVLITFTTFYAIYVIFSILTPTEEEIKKCMKVTNYSYERCEWEMTK